MKAFFTNLCNFLHEKTGNWVSITNLNEYANYAPEFVQKYNTTIPESIRELIKGP
jgi:hypothetical protein